MKLPPSLLALTPGNLCAAPAPAAHGESPGASFGADDLTREPAVRRLLAAVEEARAGGLAGVLLREPRLGDRDLLGLARVLRAILGPDAWLGLHDRVHLCAAAGADAAHLGFRSLPLGEARTVLPQGVALGCSTHADDDPARFEGADYLVHGPLFDTPSKRGWKAPVGVEAFGAFAGACRVPVWAIGGVEPAHVADVRAAGGAGVCVLRGVLAADDPRARASAYLAALESVR